MINIMHLSTALKISLVFGIILSSPLSTPILTKSGGKHLIELNLDKKYTFDHYEIMFAPKNAKAEAFTPIYQSASPKKASGGHIVIDLSQIDDSKRNPDNQFSISIHVVGRKDGFFSESFVWDEKNGNFVLLRAYSEGFLSKYKYHFAIGLVACLLIAGLAVFFLRSGKRKSIAEDHL